MRLLHYSDLENAHDDPERIGRVAGLLEALRGPDALVCGTGDNLAPGVLPLVTRGEQALAFFERVSPDVSTFGNHDFDFGAERTREVVARSPQEWISANVLDGEDPPSPFAGVSPWTVREGPDATVGLVGVTDPTTPSAAPDDDGGSDAGSGGAGAGVPTFGDPYATVDRAAEALRDRGVDHVVVLSHLGRGDERLATDCDVDAVLGGHVHTERIERLAGTLLTRPGSGGECVVEVDLAARTVQRHAVGDAPLDEVLAATYRERLANTGLDDVVGRVDEPISRTEREAFRGESRVGNFVADAYRWAGQRAVDAPEPVVGLQNSGGIRTGPPLSGAVTVADMVSLVPFEEPLVVVELDGGALRSTFREAADATGFGESDWWHAHVSGARLAYDHGDEELVRATVDGEPLDPDGRYLLATTSFLLHTEREFPTLTGREPVATLDVQYEVLAAFAREVGVDPVREGRIERTGL